jgi:two-component system NarL family sensor kinase
MAGPSEYQVALLIAIGTVGMLVLAIAIILFMVFYQKKMIQEQLNRQKLEMVYQQKMMEAALESQEEERRRVAGDLHDSIGGMLSAIRVGLITMARQLPNPQVMDQQKKMLDDTINSVRSISRDLMPSTLDKFGLVHAVKELCEEVQKTSLVPVHFHEHGEVRSLVQLKELMIFRIAQELVANAVKHSNATAIDVLIRETDHLEMIVEDNGIGFDAEAKRNETTQGKGLGLFNIENRVRLLNAKLEYEKMRDSGSKIILTVPL